MRRAPSRFPKVAHAGTERQSSSATTFYGPFQLRKALRSDFTGVRRFFTVERWMRALGINGRSTQAFLAAMSQVGSLTGRAPGVGERLRTLNGRQWAPDELALLPLFSTREVAEKTGRTVEAVEHIRA